MMTQKLHPDDLDSETLLLFITLHYRWPQDKYQRNQPKIIFVGKKKHTKCSRVHGSGFTVQGYFSFVGLACRPASI